jgi:dTDP-4-amino-4,6-dideoxygalactose transaminase
MIPIARPVLDEREAQAARRPLLSGWVTQGPEVAAFEREFAAQVGAPHACAVSSGTAALHLALRAVGVEPGTEVITVSHSFIATANSVRYCGATPVFVDVQPDTFNIDPSRVVEAVGPRTRAILCVHQMGMPCDLPPILAIAKRHNIPVVEDAACAVGSEIAWDGVWEPIGRPRGDVACFSFHPRKVITTGDGGMLTTRSADLDRQFRLWRHHGMSVSDTARHASKAVVFEAYSALGYNYRMTDIQAAVGREQLQRLPEILSRRRALAARYRVLLADIPGLMPPAEPGWACSNWQSFCVRLPESCDQAYVMQRLLDAEISSRRGIGCAHREPLYATEPWSCVAGAERCTCPGGTCTRLRESERAQERCILLPLFPQMTDAEQDLVVDTLRAACRGQGT